MTRNYTLSESDSSELSWETGTTTESDTESFALTPNDSCSYSDSEISADVKIAKVKIAADAKIEIEKYRIDSHASVERMRIRMETLVKLAHLFSSEEMLETIKSCC